MSEAEILGTFPYSQVGAPKLSGLLKPGLFLKPCGNGGGGALSVCPDTKIWKEILFHISSIVLFPSTDLY